MRKLCIRTCSCLLFFWLIAIDHNRVSAQVAGCPMSGGCDQYTIYGPPVFGQPVVTCASRRVGYDIVARSFNCNEEYHPDDFPDNCSDSKFDEPSWVNEIHAAVSVWDQQWMTMSYPNEPLFEEHGAYDNFKIKAMNAIAFAKKMPEDPDTRGTTQVDLSTYVYSEGHPCGYGGGPCSVLTQSHIRIFLNFKRFWQFGTCENGPGSARDTLIHELGHGIGFRHPRSSTGEDTVMGAHCMMNLGVADKGALTCMHFNWHYLIKPNCQWCP